MSDVTALELKQQLVEEGRVLEAKRKAADELTEKLKSLKKEWEKANSDLIAAEAAQREVVDLAESGLRQKMLDYHNLTGDKKFQSAYEIRIIPTPEYDPTVLLTWLLAAPRKLAMEMLTVDKKKTEVWIKDHVNEQGTFEPIAWCDPIPVVVIGKPTAAILSKGLASLEVPKPAVAATSDMVTISVVPNPEAALTAPESKPVVILPNIGDIPF